MSSDRPAGKSALTMAAPFCLAVERVHADVCAHACAQTLQGLTHVDSVNVI